MLRYSKYIILILLLLCTSCNWYAKKEVRGETKKEPFIRIKKYDYKTNDRVNIRIRGLENCKLNVDMEGLMFSKKFILPNKYVKTPEQIAAEADKKEKSRKRDEADDEDLVHF